MLERQQSDSALQEFSISRLGGALGSEHAPRRLQSHALGDWYCLEVRHQRKESRLRERKGDSQDSGRISLKRCSLGSTGVA